MTHFDALACCEPCIIDLKGSLFDKAWLKKISWFGNFSAKCLKEGRMFPSPKHRANRWGLRMMCAPGKRAQEMDSADVELSISPQIKRGNNFSCTAKPASLGG